MGPLPLVIQPITEEGRGSLLTQDRPGTSQTEEAGQSRAQRIRHKSLNGESKFQRLSDKLRLRIKSAGVRNKDRRAAKPGVMAEFSSHPTNIYEVPTTR